MQCGYNMAALNQANNNWENPITVLLQRVHQSWHTESTNARKKRETSRLTDRQGRESPIGPALQEAELISNSMNSGMQRLKQQTMLTSRAPGNTCNIDSW
jgi:hypothetical protein